MASGQFLDTVSILVLLILIVLVLTNTVSIRVLLILLVLVLTNTVSVQKEAHNLKSAVSDQRLSDGVAPRHC